MGKYRDKLPLTTGRTRRSDRLNSIKSDNTQQTLKDMSISDLLYHGKQIVIKGLKCSEDSEDDTIQNNLKILKRIFMALVPKCAELTAELEEQQNLTKLQEETIAKQECSILELKNNVNKCLSSIPTLEDIGEKFKTVLEENSHNSPTIIPLPPPRESPDLPVTQPTLVQGPDSARPISITAQTLPSHDRAYKRTLIVKGTSKMPGQIIQQQILKHNGHTAAKVEKILIRQHQMEIKCKSEADASYLKRELQQNQILNRTLVVLHKTIPTFKMILLDVPEQIKDTQIKENIQTNFQAREDELLFLTSFKSRKSQNTKNWIIVMPRGLGRAIIASNGLILGLKSCRLRPHTSVQRCTNCQAFDHDRKRCRSREYCSNCGDAHEPRACDLPHGCVNCLAHNNDEGTRFNTKHAASDPICPVFQAAYANERERLNSIFLQSNPVEPPIQEFQHTEDFQHPPQWPARDWTPVYRHWPLPPHEDTHDTHHRAGQRGRPF